MIGGADICIFAMYVQEYGSDCSSPNQRQVYISYLDSVQHFSPEIKCVTKEALRTYVYQEILIGYLDYCKNRGFTCCYIWSCPSKREEDFILNCHPKKQKMPRHAKLRKWYRSMVKKASDENIIVHATNFYDYFFTQSNGCKSRVTITRLPYFDGDYWPTHAEIILNNLMKEEECSEPKKKLIKRDTKIFKHKQPIEDCDKDALLIDKIGSSIRPMKEDFILAHLQHACNHCSQFIISGNRWICNCCEKFQLCDSCYNIEKTLDDKQKHSSSRRGKHTFSPVEIISWPLRTTDEDDIVKSNYFDCRLKFLDLCQRMHFQFDTLRRAKHSTMMILYLHYNSISPNSENRIIGQNHSCYQTSRHISNILDHNILRAFLKKCFEVLHIESEYKFLWGKDLVKLFHFLEHAAQCRGKGCKNIICRRLKQLFRHCAKCNVRRRVESCRECNVVWLLLKFHARACNKLACQVPHCIRIQNFRLRSSSRNDDGKMDITS
ncbi:hypothetical protein ZOSMA_141G00020 [Zostera marina]|uniref:histone acetyltransferase n=1 Tax=Zostera marina TaxID=29655 RepID=A0A0K9PXF8_ZOSMR|nr:hypothetical protein ZOSMA_141G00020 [Zostera marina]